MEEMGFDLLRLFGCYFLFKEGYLLRIGGVGFMIQERRELEEQFICSIVSLRACCN
jgi:hypothetical protein